MAERPRQVVIVGGGPAGDAAAFSLRRRGFEGNVTILSADSRRPYRRPNLSKELLQSKIEEEHVYLRPESEYPEQRIELLLGQRVVGADRSERAVILEDGRRLPFDVLILATGGVPRKLTDMPELQNVFTLRSFDDGAAIKEALAKSQRLLVVGAGFIGVEVAASARAGGREVVLVHPDEVPLGRVLGEEVGQFLGRIHREQGVDDRPETKVTGWIHQASQLQGVQLSDGSRVEVDAAVIAVGIDPAVGLAEDLGLQLGQGGVLVDEALRAETRIYCLGDIAYHLHPVLGRRIRVEHWQVAHEQGDACGRALTSGLSGYDRLPWFWSDQYDLALQYLGNAEKSAQRVWRGNREGKSFSVFYLSGGCIEAVLSVNDGGTIQHSHPLIRQRKYVDPRLLADPETDLSGLGGS
jgi:3-phenylpropionate/trans-cinnamate dioxygenase ferredoxin reductase subunit